ncbi:MAG: CrcB family protein [Phenylobacterium sp.]|uniref:CrcB family protein n=1 Tax=Phenylobacterium sp. TaxID=1871053 RepID=UPI00391CED25
MALGGALGAMLRFWLSGVVDRRIGGRFPWGVLSVNVTGAAALGLMAGALLEPGRPSAALPLWLALAVGVLGSYTTVSSFSLQTLILVQNRELRRAAWNVAASLLLCLTAAAAGLAAGQWLAGG